MRLDTKDGTKKKLFLHIIALKSTCGENFANYLIGPFLLFCEFFSFPVSRLFVYFFRREGVHWNWHANVSIALELEAQKEENV